MAVPTGRQSSPVERDSPSPAPPPTLTKRDVRRNRMMEKLQNMVTSFSSNQHHHYRAQLQAVQVDMTLVLRADPYEGMPLEDGGEEIRQMVESMNASLPQDEAAQRDYWALAGSRYQGFVSQVNNAIEQRDSDLTMLNAHYHSSAAELQRLTQQRLHQAEEEHKALSNTIRQRLVTSVSKRKAQLLRDKEQLDIADSNALLLHPNQFSLTHPGSPSIGQNRKTRHLRHRATSPSAGDENGKRKRKATVMDDEGNESPIPAFRLPPADNLGGGRSPFRDARKDNIYAQYEAPAYSLERLFTEKELALATDIAKTATYKYFQQQQHPTQDSSSNTNGTTNPSVDGELPDSTGSGEDANAATDNAANGAAASPPPAAPEMERSTSHQVLTRGGARANPLAALSDLATAAAAASGSATVPLLRDNPFAPVVPSYHAVTRSEKSGAPAPPGVSVVDADNDFEMMRRAGQHSNAPAGNIDTDGDNNMEMGSEDTAARDMRNALLDQALGISAMSAPYRLPLLEIGPALIGRGVDRIPGTGFAPVPSLLEQRLRQQAVASGAPTAPIGPGGSMAAALRGQIGGEAMSRTTSAAGSEPGELGSAVGRRGRAGKLV